MKYVIIDLFEGIKFSELSQRGWNIISIMLLFISGMFWWGFCDYGAIFQILGCISYIISVFLFIKKSSWGCKFVEFLKGEH